MSLKDAVMRFLWPPYSDDRPKPQLHAAEVPRAIEFEQHVAAHDREMQSIGAMVDAIRGTGMTPPPSSGELHSHELGSSPGTAG